MVGGLFFFQSPVFVQRLKIVTSVLRLELGNVVCGCYVPQNLGVFHTAKCYMTVVVPLTCPFAPFALFCVRLVGACRIEGARMRKRGMYPQIMA